MMNSEIYWDELSDAIDNAIEEASDWADYGDWAEEAWSDSDDESDVGGEDAYLDSYWESLTEM